MVSTRRIITEDLFFSIFLGDNVFFSKVEKRPENEIPGKNRTYRSLLSHVIPHALPLSIMYFFTLKIVNDLFSVLFLLLLLLQVTPVFKREFIVGEKKEIVISKPPRKCHSTF